MIKKDLIKITKDGSYVPDYSEINNYILARIRDIYGTDIDVSNISQDGKFLELISEIINNALQAAKFNYDKLDINKAIGIFLDTICSYENVSRTHKSSSEVKVWVKNISYSEQNPESILLIDNENRNWIWENDKGIDGELKTIWSKDPLEVKELTFYCEEKGSYSLIGHGNADFEAWKANTSDKMNYGSLRTVDYGIFTLYQKDDAISGNNEETDEELRSKRSKLLGNQSVTLTEGLKGSLLNLDGVRDCYIYNNNNSTQINNLYDYTSFSKTGVAQIVPVHSIFVALDYDNVNDNEIAKLIHNKLTPGCETAVTEDQVNGYSRSDKIAKVLGQYYQINWKKINKVKLSMLEESTISDCHRGIGIKIKLLKDGFDFYKENGTINKEPHTAKTEAEKKIVNNILNYLNNIKIAEAMKSGNILSEITKADLLKDNQLTILTSECLINCDVHKERKNYISNNKTGSYYIAPFCRYNYKFEDVMFYIASSNDDDQDKYLNCIITICTPFEKIYSIENNIEPKGKSEIKFDPKEIEENGFSVGIISTINNERYKLPRSLTINNANLLKYSYDNTCENGTIIINNPIEKVSTNGELVKIYSITTNITNGTYEGDIEAETEGSVRIIANNGYVLPDNIEVNIEKEKYTYDKTTGIIKLLSITQDIEIKAVCLKKHSIITNIIHGTYKGDSFIVEGKIVECSISADSKYKLPTSITVTNASYTYDSATGKIILSNPTGDIEINAECVAILNEYSWEEIKEISKNGQAQNIFNVGDTKSVVVNDQTHYVRIIAFNHDKDENNNTLGITFEFVNVISDTNGNSLNIVWNDTNDTSSTGTCNKDYINSSVRKALCGSGNFSGDLLWCQKGATSFSATYKNRTILSMLPSDLVSVLKTTKKSVGIGNSYTETSYTDKLFMLSYLEMGYKKDTEKGYGTTYSYYSGHTERIDAIRSKKQVNDSEVYTHIFQIPSGSGQVYHDVVFNFAGYNYGGGALYWYRSPSSDYSYRVCSCSGSGSCDIADNAFNKAYAIAPAFCV